MQTADDAPKLVAVRAPDDVIARRHQAARRAGIPITDALSFDYVPAPKEQQQAAQNPLHPGGNYKPQHTRPLTNAEWETIADLLPDEGHATLTYRKFLNDILRYVISGWSWRDVGYGQHYPASRERVRRKRGKAVWAKVAQRAETWEDGTMVSQMLRVCQWLTDPSDMSLLAVAPLRRYRSKAANMAAQRKRSEYGGVPVPAR